MQGESEANHAAINAWLDGSLTPVQRQEFEAHLATCSECQAHVTTLLKVKLPATAAVPVSIRPELPPAPPPRKAHRTWIIVICAVGVAAVLGVGYALGSWAWDLAHR